MSSPDTEAPTGRTTAAIFLHVPPVKLPKRLDLDCYAERANAAVPLPIVAKLVKGRIN